MVQNVVVHKVSELGEIDRLASKLIKSLGFEGALSCCRENHWDGVLNAIMRRLKGGDA